MTALKCYNRIINVKLLERSKQITLQCEVRKRLYQSLNTCLLTSCGTDSIRPHAISLQLLCNSSSNGCSCGWNTSINSMSYHSMFVNVVVELHYSALRLGTDKVLLTNTELRLSVFVHDRNTEEEIRAPTDLFRFEDFLNTYYPYKVGPITCFHNVNEWSLMCFRFCYVDEWLAMSCFLAWVINKYIQSVWSILEPGMSGPWSAVSSTSTWSAFKLRVARYSTVATFLYCRCSCHEWRSHLKCVCRRSCRTLSETACWSACVHMCWSCAEHL